jgi:dolichyl-phosphate-mannose--protein O-mannosyl transferase
VNVRVLAQTPVIPDKNVVTKHQWIKRDVTTLNAKQKRGFHKKSLFIFCLSFSFSLLPFFPLFRLAEFRSFAPQSPFLLLLPHQYTYR